MGWYKSNLSARPEKHPNVFTSASNNPEEPFPVEKEAMPHLQII